MSFELDVFRHEQKQLSIIVLKFESEDLRDTPCVACNSLGDILEIPFTEGNLVESYTVGFIRNTIEQHIRTAKVIINESSNGYQGTIQVENTCGTKVYVTPFVIKEYPEAKSYTDTKDLKCELNCAISAMGGLLLSGIPLDEFMYFPMCHN